MAWVSFFVLSSIHSFAAPSTPCQCTTYPDAFAEAGLDPPELGHNVLPAATGRGRGNGGQWWGWRQGRLGVSRVFGQRTGRPATAQELGQHVVGQLGGRGRRQRGRRGRRGGGRTGRATKAALPVDPGGEGVVVTTHAVAEPGARPVAAVQGLHPRNGVRRARGRGRGRGHRAGLGGHSTPAKNSNVLLRGLWQKKEKKNGGGERRREETTPGGGKREKGCPPACGWWGGGDKKEWVEWVWWKWAGAFSAERSQRRVHVASRNEKGQATNPRLQIEAPMLPSVLLTHPTNHPFQRNKPCTWAGGMWCVV